MIYEYSCEKCRRIFDIEHGMKEKAKKRCPKCKKNSLKRLISGGGVFLLKGAGWYKDGYSSPKPETKGKNGHE